MDLMKGWCFECCPSQSCTTVDEACSTKTCYKYLKESVVSNASVSRREWIVRCVAQNVPKETHSQNGLWVELRMSQRKGRRHISYIVHRQRLELPLPLSPWQTTGNNTSMAPPG